MIAERTHEEAASRPQQGSAARWPRRSPTPLPPNPPPLDETIPEPWGELCASHPRIEWLYPAQLHLDVENYQREPTPKVVERIRKEFLFAALGTIIVARRPDGSYWALDGAHRVQAVWEQFGDDAPLRALVIDVETIEEEAEIFRAINAIRAKPRPENLWRVRLRMHEPVAVEIRKILRERGLVMPFDADAPQHGRERIVKALPAIEGIYNDPAIGQVGLKRLLDFLIQVWGDQPYLTHAETLKGTAQFIKRFSKCATWREADVIERLRDVAPMELARRQARLIGERARYERARSFAYGLQELYNKGLPKKDQLVERDAV